MSPAGQTLATASATTVSMGAPIATIGSLTLSASGSYIVLLQQGPGVNTGSYRIRVKPVVDATLARSSITDVTFTPGTGATLAFDGTAGEMPNLMVSCLNACSASTDRGYTITVVAPDGTTIASGVEAGTPKTGGVYSVNDLLVRLPRLTQTGSYLVLLGGVDARIGGSLRFTHIAAVNGSYSEAAVGRVLGMPISTGANGVILFPTTTSRNYYVTFKCNSSTNCTLKGDSPFTVSVIGPDGIVRSTNILPASNTAVLTTPVFNTSPTGTWIFTVVQGSLASFGQFQFMVMPAN